MSYSPYAPPRQDPRGPYAGYGPPLPYQPLGWKTTAIIVGILATVVLELATTGLSWAVGGVSDASNMGALMAAGLLGLLQSGVSLFTMVVFLVWIHNAAKNVRTFGHEGLRFTPGWAVGWWFIPIASMWMPFLAMREIWRASDPESVGRGHPGGWMTSRVPATFGVWWATYLLAGFVGAFAALPVLLNPGSATTAAPAISMVSHAFNAVAAITIVVLVKKLADNQDASHEKLRAMEQAGGGGGYGGPPGYGSPPAYGAPPGYGPPGYPPYGSST